MKNILKLCAVGDVKPMRDEPEKMFELCEDAFKEFDLKMCHLETNFMGAKPEVGVKKDPSQIKALTSIGFDIATFAGNHALFGGEQAMLDGIKLVRDNGIEIVGAGENLAEARRPVFIECKGVKLAFLNYGSILHENEAALESRPGIAPLRIKTMYEPFETNQPGCPPIIHTFPVYEDMDAMLADIKKAKFEADIVVLAFHWGIHHMPIKLAAYEKPVAHYAIDAGADIIIGTHPHILKGIEVYKEKVIFYSLGNFAFDHFPAMKAWPPSERRKKVMEMYDIQVDPAWIKTYPFRKEARITIAVKCLISNEKIEKVSYLPAMIGIDARPRILQKTDEGFDEVINYVTHITEKAGLNANFKVEDNEVVISAKP